MFKKLICFFLLLIFLFSFFYISVFAESAEYSWFIKRNGNKRPLLQKGQEIINEYNAFYIDNNVNDDSEDKVIYITFDAGYENGNIAKIMDALKEESVCAAFFILDNIILKNTELVTRMVTEGHTVCNHTKNHKNLSGATERDIESNIKSLEILFKEKTGYEMSKYFRFPEGRYSENALKCVKSLGYKTIFWSFAYDDWDNSRQPDTKRAFKKIIENTHNGAVFLFHPTSKTNAEIFPELIKEWRRMGYRFGTLDELVSDI